jgi:tellurite resistance protein
MQIEAAIPGQGAPQEDWFSTHPFSPLRVKALQLFDRSELIRENGTRVEELEVDVRALMGMMEASYLDGRTENDEAMRRLLFAGALTVANAHDGVGEEEIAVFEKYFGEGSFDQNLDLSALAADLDKRIEQVREHTTTSQSMHVLRDLCLVARADGHIDETEREVLNRIADGLGVSRALICQTLDSNPELD